VGLRRAIGGDQSGQSQFPADPDGASGPAGHCMTLTNLTTRPVSVARRMKPLCSLSTASTLPSGRQATGTGLANAPGWPGEPAGRGMSCANASDSPASRIGSAATFSRPYGSALSTERDGSGSSAGRSSPRTRSPSAK
jgi:hypothetical protein